MNGSASQYLEHFDRGYDEHVADEKQEQEQEQEYEAEAEEYENENDSNEEIVTSSPASTATTTTTSVISNPNPAVTMNEIDSLSSSFVLVDHNGHDQDVQQVKEQDDMKYQQQSEQEREQEREKEDQVFKGPKSITLADFMVERSTRTHTPARKVSRSSQHGHRSPALVGRVSSTPTSTSLFPDETPIPNHIDELKSQQCKEIDDKPLTTSTSARLNIFTLMKDGGGQSKLVTQINQDEIEPSSHFRTSSSLDVWLLICFFLRPIDVCRLTSTCEAMKQTLLSHSSRYWRRLYDLRYGITTSAIASLPESVQPISGQHWLRQYALRVVYHRKCRRGEGYIPLQLSTIPTSYPPLIKQPTATPPQYIDTSHDGWMVSFHPGHVSSLHFYDTRYRPTPWSDRTPSNIPLTAPILRTIQSDAMVHVISGEGSNYVHAPFITHQIHHTYQAIDAIVDWKEEIVVIMSKQHLEIFKHATKPRLGPEAVITIEAPAECTFISIRWVQLVRPIVTSTTSDADGDATTETPTESIPTSTSTSTATATATDEKIEMKSQLTLIVCVSNGDVCVYTQHGVLVHTYVSTLHQVMSPSASASTSHKKPSYIFNISETTVIRAYHTYVDVIRLDRQRISQPFRNSTSSTITSIHACQYGVITVHTSGVVILRTNGGLKQIIRDAPNTTMSNSVQVSTINHQLGILVLFQAEPQLNNRLLGGHLLFYTFDTSDGAPTSTPTSAPTSTPTSTPAPTSTSTSPFRLFHTISTPPLIFQGSPRVDISHDQILIHLIPSTTVPITFGASLGSITTPCIISSDTNLISPRLSLISYLWTDLHTSILVATDIYCYHIKNNYLVVAESNGLLIKSRLLGGGENYSSIHTSIRVSSPRIINYSCDYWYDPILYRKKQDESRKKQQVQTNIAALEYERRLRIQQQQDDAYQQRMKQRQMDRAVEERRARQQAQERRGGRDRKKDPFVG